MISTVVYKQRIVGVLVGFDDVSVCCTAVGGIGCVGLGKWGVWEEI
jgi:hypothetical protein